MAVNFIKRYITSLTFKRFSEQKQKFKRKKLIFSNNYNNKLKLINNYMY